MLQGHVRIQTGLPEPFLPSLGALERTSAATGHPVGSYPDSLQTSGHPAVLPQQGPVPGVTCSTWQAVALTAGSLSEGRRKQTEPLPSRTGTRHCPGDVRADSLPRAL